MTIRVEEAPRSAVLAPAPDPRLGRRRDPGRQRPALARGRLRAGHVCRRPSGLVARRRRGADAADAGPGLQAHPLVEEARNQVAFQRGPIVYCLESTDLPEGVRVLDVAVPGKVELTPRFDPALLGGVTVLEGRAEAGRERPWSGDALPGAPRATIRGRSTSA